MAKFRLWLELLVMLSGFSLTKCASVSNDDLILDSLLPINSTKNDTTTDFPEGSGDDDFYQRRIIELTGELSQTMQRMQAYEGSGFNPTEEEEKSVTQDYLVTFNEPIKTNNDLSEYGSGDFEATSHPNEINETDIETTTNFIQNPTTEDATTEIITNFSTQNILLPIIDSNVETLHFEKVSLESSKENIILEANMIENNPKKLGIYIISGMVALTFIALIVFLAIRGNIKKKKKRHEFDKRDKDTEKALLNLHKFKEDTDENNIKNNEITPLMMKPSQINKFEKSNFSLPKNLNTTANEKNIAKDNVLKSENLTHAIIEDADPDTEKTVLSEPEKLIVRALIDNDSVPKKPIIVNRNSNGYTTVPQEPSDHKA